MPSMTDLSRESSQNVLNHRFGFLPALREVADDLIACRPVLLKIAKAGPKHRLWLDLFRTASHIEYEIRKWFYNTALFDQVARMYTVPNENVFFGKIRAMDNAVMEAERISASMTEVLHLRCVYQSWIFLEDNQQYIIDELNREALGDTPENVRVRVGTNTTAAIECRRIESELAIWLEAADLLREVQA